MQEKYFGGKINKIRKFTIKLRSNIILRSCKGMIKENDLVIDIGCGNGFMSNIIKEKFKCRMEGYDIKNTLEYDMPFIDVDNVPDKYYDIALIIDTLHHIPFEDQIKLVNKAKRISKKVIIFESKTSFVNWLSDLLETEMIVTNTTRKLNEWEDALVGFKYTFVRKPFYYPIIHYLFVK